MRGSVAKKGKRWYAVVYDGIDPATGKYRRRWVPAGTRRGDAEKLLADLVKRSHEGNTVVSEKVTLAAYLLDRWLPVQEPRLRRSTYDSYRRNIERHVVPALGAVPLDKLTVEDLEVTSQERQEQPGRDAHGQRVQQPEPAARQADDALSHGHASLRPHGEQEEAAAILDRALHQHQAAAEAGDGGADVIARQASHRPVRQSFPDDSRAVADAEPIWRHRSDHRRLPQLAQMDGLQMIEVALVVLIAMLVLALAAARFFRGLQPVSGWLMLPYLLWLCLSVALNYETGRLNPGADAAPLGLIGA